MRRISIKKARVGVVLLTTLGAGLFAAPAHAAASGVATLAAGSDTIRFTAAGKATNKLVITRSGRTVTIDDRVRLRAGRGCTAVKGDATRVRCTFTITDQGNLGLQARLGDRNDSLTTRANIRLSVFGGSGNDAISGGSASDVLRGESGKDRLWGNGGSDSLEGGSSTDSLSGGSGSDRLSGGTGVDKLYGDSGDDQLRGDSGADQLAGGGGNDGLFGHGGRDLLDGGDGDDTLKPDFMESESGDDGPDVKDPIAADVVRGGAGTDLVDYSDRRRNPVTVDLDGEAGDDGRSGEGDTVGADVEKLFGTIYADRLTGNASGNEIRGGGGNDVLAGLGGADRLFGDDGDDDLSGEDSGSDQADHLDGGSQYTPAGDLCRVFPADIAVNCER